MKNYIWITLLFAVSHLYCNEDVNNSNEWNGEESLLDELMNQIETRNPPSQLESSRLDFDLNRAHGPDWFARVYRGIANRQDVSAQDRVRYSELADKIAEQVNR